MLTDYLVLSGTALNYLGAIDGLINVLKNKPRVARSGQHIKYQLFTSGAAATFGSIYLYLFLRPQYINPFLAFGAALKYWAYVSAWIAYKHYGLSRAEYVSFGVSNAVVGTLLWISYVARVKAGTE
ncbi:hypothetical protein BDV40DRAFT_302504 [Aspergillus tamarii]|uniref:Uncharacterized protein n=1 Tax=Aspergillus tamarii TaxID=41984 RepID=A0A5N6UNI0_ASPTM|nr:hypothetical protein BDV40DRAFT_302504 [Aspergillus tamarii]